MSKYDRVPPTQGMLAQELGVSEVSLWNWKQLPGFAEQVNETMRSGMKDRLNEVYGALLREAEKGSYHHIKLVLEMAGEYTRVQKNINENTGETTVRFVWGDAAPVRLIEADDDDIIDGEYAEDE